MGVAKIEPKHDFASKLRQPSLLPNVLRYIEWQKAVRRAHAEGAALPEIPDWLGPVSINLDLTTACNYRCDHCIDFDILNSPIRYAHEKLMGSLSNMIERGLRSVIFIGGGEPTLYPKFGETISFLKERNIQVAVVSNGSRNEVIYDSAEFFTEKDWVRLSLDAGTNDTFIRMHKPVKAITLEEICSWVPRIRDKNPRFQLGFSFIIVWESAEAAHESGKVSIVPNIEEMVEATKLARKHRFSYISFKPFLTRYPSGAEVMDPSVISDFQKTINRIRIALNEAKTYETKDFRIIESTNLRVLEKNTWQELTRQPQTCHMQAFHQVLSPLGLFNCPAWRGVEKGRIYDKKAYSDPNETKETQKQVANIIDQFDSSRECAHITCLYNSANWWLEKAIKGELTPDEFEAMEERFDYYF